MILILLVLCEFLLVLKVFRCSEKFRSSSFQFFWNQCGATHSGGCSRQRSDRHGNIKCDDLVTWLRCATINRIPWHITPLEILPPPPCTGRSDNKGGGNISLPTVKNRGDCRRWNITPSPCTGRSGNKGVIFQGIRLIGCSAVWSRSSRKCPEC